MDIKKLKGKFFVREDDTVVTIISCLKKGITIELEDKQLGSTETKILSSIEELYPYVSEEVLIEATLPKPRKAKGPEYTNPIVLYIHSHLKKSENVLDLLGVESEDSLPTDPEEFLNWYWETRIKVCTKCSLCESRTNVVKYDGKVGAKVMVIAEGPGFLEDLTSIPMVGMNQLLVSRCNTCVSTKECFGSRLLKYPNSWGRRAKKVDCNYKPAKLPSIRPGSFYIRSAGQVIDGILNSIDPGLKRQSYYDGLNKQEISPLFFTNVALCRSTDPSGSKDQTPDSLTIKQCRIHLLVQLACIRPKVVVLLGSVSAQSLHMKESNFRELTDSRYGCFLIKDRHPAFIMRLDTPEEKASGYALLRNTFKKALDCAYEN